MSRSCDFTISILNLIDQTGYMTLAEGLQLVEEDKLALYALPVFLLVIIAEAWISKHEQKNLYERKDFIASIWMLFSPQS